MKWPASVTLIRHDVSAYNELKKIKENHPDFLKFKAAFERNPGSKATKLLACKAWEVIRLSHGDHDTPLASGTAQIAKATGFVFRASPVPDVIFVSPYKRTLETLKRIQEGWPESKGAKVVEDERIREQEHGLGLIYNDWMIFQALHPEQRLLHKIEGRYWYRHPQGENVPDVRLRVRSWMSSMMRDFAGLHVLAVTHHLCILAMRANFERLGAEEFLRLDTHEKPVNCGVTRYEGNPREGKDGRLNLAYYNRKFY